MKVSRKLGSILVPLVVIILLVAFAFTALAQGSTITYLDEGTQGLSANPAGTWGWISPGKDSATAYIPLNGQTGTLIMADPDGQTHCSKIKSYSFSAAIKVVKQGNMAISFSAVNIEGKSWPIVTVPAITVKDWFYVSQQVAGLTETGLINLAASSTTAAGEIMIDKVTLTEECDDPITPPTPDPVTPTPCPARAAITSTPQGLPKIDGVTTVQLLFLPHLERGDNDGGC